MKKWARYKRSAMLYGEAVMDQLWACMDEPLEQAANNNRLDGCTTEDKLMTRIKALAVKGQNVCINRVKFLEMGQDSGEPVTSFVAKL